MAILTNCNGSNASLQFVVLTSVLCPNNLEWRLSVDNMTAFCTKTKAKDYMYGCLIKLKPAVSGVAIARLLDIAKTILCSGRYLQMAAK